MLDEEAPEELIEGFLQRLEAQYPYMEGHWRRVALQAWSMGEALDLGREALDRLRTCSLVLDIGMLDDAIYSLVAADAENGVDFMQNPDVRLVVERHPIIGARMLEELGFPGEVTAAVRHHHEWYNGWGYPDGLSGVTIPMLARILAVADAFVNITRDQPFRAGCEDAEALEEIVGYAGVQFDPWVVPALQKAVSGEAGVPESLIDRTIDLALEE